MEFDYDSDGEIIITNKQKMNRYELEKSLSHILHWDMTPWKLRNISRGCTKEMIKVMVLAKE